MDRSGDSLAHHREPQIVDKLVALLAAQRARPRSRIEALEIDPESGAQLEALGYQIDPESGA